MAQNGFWYSYRTRPFVWAWQLEVLWELAGYDQADGPLSPLQPTHHYHHHSDTVLFSHRERRVLVPIKRRTQVMFWSDCVSYLLLTLNFNDPLESLRQVILLFGRQRKVVLIWDNFKRLFALKFVHIWLLNLGWHERMSRQSKNWAVWERTDWLTENKCEIDLHCQREIASPGSGRPS